MKKPLFKILVLSCILLLFVGQMMQAQKKLKEQAVIDLQALLPTEDDETDKRIEKAIEHLNMSLDSGLWEDDRRLTQKGNKVFDQEKKAVRELMKIEGIDVSEIIDSLVSIDMTLAQIAVFMAIETAAAEGCYDEDNDDPECDKELREIAKAETEMDKAKEEYDKGQHRKAIDHCKKAWMHAQKAMKKLPEIGKILFTRGHVDECGFGYAFYVYLYDGATGNIDTVKENCNDARGLNLNPDLTMIVYTEIENENGGPSPIYVYDIDSKTTTTIAAACYNEQGAFFDADGKILFRDYEYGDIKKINTDGTGLTTVAEPEPPYEFSMFWISPDHEKIAIVECRKENPNFPCSHVRLVMMNSDGTDRSVIQDEFLGRWNYLAWKQDSSGFLYYHHVKEWISGDWQSIPKYISFDISKKRVRITDLSDSDLGIEENICFYTKSGNLISLGYRELYDGKTGAFIADLSSEIPPMNELMSMMGGWDIYTGEMYIADSDGSNLRRLNIMEL